MLAYMTMDEANFPDEDAFLKGTGDAYGLYQLKGGSENRTVRFASLSMLQHLNQAVEKDRYQLVYTGPLPAQDSRSTQQLLADLYMRFNPDYLRGFSGRSMSVSDVVVLRQNGQMSAWFTDSFRFERLPDFLPPDNPLKNAEMMIEDDYGMIDGIINNDPKQAARSRWNRKRKSRRDRRPGSETIWNDNPGTARCRKGMIE